MHCSIPFYVRRKHLQILVSVKGGAVLEPNHCGCQGTKVVKFSGSQNYTWIFNCITASTSNPCTLQESTVVKTKNCYLVENMHRKGSTQS